MGQNDAVEQGKHARQLQSRGLLSQEVESYSALPFLADDAILLLQSERFSIREQREHVARLDLDRFINHISRRW